MNEKEILLKINLIFKKQYFQTQILKLTTSLLKATFLFLIISIFYSLSIKLALILCILAILKIILTLVNFYLWQPDLKECYKKMDDIFQLDQRAITYYEIITNKINSNISNDIIQFLKYDFNETLQNKLFDKKFQEKLNNLFTKQKINFPTKLKILSCFVIIITIFNFYKIYSINNFNNQSNKENFKTVSNNTIQTLEKLIEKTSNEITIFQTLTELNNFKSKLLTLNTNEDINNELKNTISKIKNIQFENKTRCIKEFKNLKEKVNKFINTLSQLNDDKHQLSNNMKLDINLQKIEKLIENYLNNKNDKELLELTNEINKFVEEFNNNLENLKKKLSSLDNNSQQFNNKKTNNNSTQNNITDNEELNSKLKHLNRLSGKELLDLLKNDKSLQELYSMLNMLNDENLDLHNILNEKLTQNENINKNNPNEAQNQITNEQNQTNEQMNLINNLGLGISKPGDQSTNLKENPSEAPLMSFQNRQSKDLTKQKGEWEAFFNPERFNIDPKISKVKSNINNIDKNAQTIEINEFALPTLGKANSKIIKEMINFSKKQSTTNFEQLPSNAKKIVSDYFKKLNENLSK